MVIGLYRITFDSFEMYKISLVSLKQTLLTRLSELISDK